MSNHLKFITTHPPFRVNDQTKVELIRQELERILKHQEKLHEMDTDYALETAVGEALEALEGYLDWGPSDDDLIGEPPITADEMHSAAWQEHLAAHR